MINAGAMDKALDANLRSLRMGEQGDDGLSRAKPSKRPSTDSVCSTVDTLSDTSDDHDANSRSMEVTCGDVPADISSTLRANAPEFVPHVAASTPSLVQDLDSPSLCELWSSTPVCSGEDSLLCLPLWGESPCCNNMDPTFLHSGDVTNPAVLGFDSSCYLGEAIMSDVHIPVVNDGLEAVSQRYLEWHHYCGLTGLEGYSSPQSFSHLDAHSCSMADLFTLAKPGELFVCHGHKIVGQA